MRPALGRASDRVTLHWKERYCLIKHLLVSYNAHVHVLLLQWLRSEPVSGTWKQLGPRLGTDSEVRVKKQGAKQKALGRETNISTGHLQYENLGRVETV